MKTFERAAWSTVESGSIFLWFGLKTCLEMQNRATDLILDETAVPHYRGHDLNRTISLQLVPAETAARLIFLLEIRDCSFANGFLTSSHWLEAHIKLSKISIFRLWRSLKDVVGITTCTLSASTKRSQGTFDIWHSFSQQRFKSVAWSTLHSNQTFKAASSSLLWPSTQFSGKPNLSTDWIAGIFSEPRY